MECLDMEAHITSGDILANIPRHLRPPIVVRNQFQCFPPSAMSCNLGIMAKENNPLSEIK
jgi:hypothetical protein